MRAPLTIIRRGTAPTDRLRKEIVITVIYAQPVLVLAVFYAFAHYTQLRPPPDARPP